MRTTTRFNLIYAMIAVIGILVLHDLWVGYQSVTPLAHSEFQKLVIEGKIKEIVITAGENRMAVLMGGRAAEHVIFSHFSTGAPDDLARIADIARSMVTRHAMEPALGHVAFETDQRSSLGPGTEPLRQRLYGARLLLRKETLDTPDLEQIFRAVKPAPATFTPANAPCSQRGASPVHEEAHA